MLEWVATKGVHLQRALTSQQAEQAWQQGRIDVTWWRTPCWVRYQSPRGLSSNDMTAELGIREEKRRERTNYGAYARVALN